MGFLRQIFGKTTIAIDKFSLKKHPANNTVRQDAGIKILKIIIANALYRLRLYADIHSTQVLNQSINTLRKNRLH